MSNDKVEATFHGRWVQPHLCKSMMDKDEEIARAKAEAVIYKTQALFALKIAEMTGIAYKKSLDQIRASIENAPRDSVELAKIL